jgi:hypothetical protein
MALRAVPNFWGAPEVRPYQAKSNAYRARPTRDLSAIGRLLFSGSLHNLGEAPGIEAGAADECPINIRLRH